MDDPRRTRTRIGACVAVALLPLACRDDAPASDPVVANEPTATVVSAAVAAVAPVPVVPPPPRARVAAIFGDARPFSEGIAAVTDPRTASQPKEPQRWGLLRQDGSWLVEPRFRVVSDMVGGRALIEGDGGVEKIFADGRREALPDATSLQVVGAFVLMRTGDGLQCLADPEGRCLVHVDELPVFEEDIAIVKHGGKQGIATRDGVLAVPTRFDAIAIIAPRVATLRLGEELGLWTGKRIVEPAFGALGSTLAEDRLAVAIDGKWGFLDREGAIVVAASYDEVDEFSEGRAAVARAGKWGFVDRDGTEIGELVHDSVGWFSEGLAELERDGRWGYVDLHGNVAIEPQFLETSAFVGKHAWVKTETSAGVIDKTGNFTAAPQTAAILVFDGAVAIAKSDEHLECLRFTAKRGWQRKRLPGDSVAEFEHGRAVVEGEVKLWVDDAHDTDPSESVPSFWGRADVCGYVDESCRMLWKLSTKPLSASCLPFTARGFAAIEVWDETSCLTGPVCSSKARAVFIDRKGTHVGRDHAAIEATDDGRFRVQDHPDDPWRVVDGPEPASPPGVPRLEQYGDGWRFVDERGQSLDVEVLDEPRD